MSLFILKTNVTDVSFVAKIVRRSFVLVSMKISILVIGPKNAAYVDKHLLPEAIGTDIEAFTLVQGMIAKYVTNLIRGKIA